MEVNSTSAKILLRKMLARRKCAGFGIRGTFNSAQASELLVHQGFRTAKTLVTRRLARFFVFRRRLKGSLGPLFVYSPRLSTHFCTLAMLSRLLRRLPGSHFVPFEQADLKTSSPPMPLPPEVAKGMTVLPEKS